MRDLPPVAAINGVNHLVGLPTGVAVPAVLAILHWQEQVDVTDLFGAVSNLVRRILDQVEVVHKRSSH